MKALIVVALVGLLYPTKLSADETAALSPALNNTIGLVDWGAEFALQGVPARPWSVGVSFTFFHNKDSFGQSPASFVQVTENSLSGSVFALRREPLRNETSLYGLLGGSLGSCSWRAQHGLYPLSQESGEEPTGALRVGFGVEKERGSLLLGGELRLLATWSPRAGVEPDAHLVFSLGFAPPPQPGFGRFAPRFGLLLGSASFD